MSRSAIQVLERPRPASRPKSGVLPPGDEEDEVMESGSESEDEDNEKD